MPPHVYLGALLPHEILMQVAGDGEENYYRNNLNLLTYAQKN